MSLWRGSHHAFCWVSPRRWSTCTPPLPSPTMPARNGPWKSNAWHRYPTRIRWKTRMHARGAVGTGRATPATALPNPRCLGWYRHGSGTIEFGTWAWWSLHWCWRFCPTPCLSHKCLCLPRSVTHALVARTFENKKQWIRYLGRVTSHPPPRFLCSFSRYMTLLNTVANLGSKWSSQAFRYCTDKADKYVWLLKSLF